MNDEILIYAKLDSNKSIVQIVSSIFVEDTKGYTQIDAWHEGQDRYIYIHADNGEYVMNKRGKPLYDDLGRPNFHDDFIEWTEEEKQAKYPIRKPETSGLEKLKKQQELTDQAVQDLILMMMGGGE